MEFVTIIIFLALYYEAAESRGVKFTVEKNCNKLQTFKVKKEVPYEDVHFSTSSGKFDIEKKFRIEEIEVERFIEVCCDGYHSINEELCIPLCSKGCGSQGICSAPEVCICEEDHYIFDQKHGNCKPTCDPECKFAYCIAPNVCSCKEGYKWSKIDRECKPICDNCTKEETCVEPHVCRCKKGFTRQLMTRPDNLNVSMCRPVCQDECINAECVGPNECQCYENYTRISGSTCIAHRYHISDFAISKNCTEIALSRNIVYPPYTQYEEDIRFVLSNETMSICCNGYQNFYDDKCIPICNKSCGSQGICSAPNVCKCQKGYEMDNDLHDCKPLCERGCLNGRCIEPNMCACNDGYKKVLEFACAPICSRDCFMGICTAPDTCTCREGFVLSTTNKFECQSIEFRRRMAQLSI